MLLQEGVRSAVIGCNPALLPHSLEDKEKIYKGLPAYKRIFGWSELDTEAAD